MDGCMTPGKSGGMTLRIRIHEGLSQCTTQADDFTMEHYETGA